MPRFEYTLPSQDGLALFGQGWQPEGAVRGVVCLVHGLGEHSGRYAHVATHLNRSGYAVLALDLRGHGRSPGQRGHAPNYAALLDDIDCLLAEAVRRWPGQTRFLFGHSLGGGLVLNHALRRQPAIAGVIAMAPWLVLAFKPPTWKLAAGKLSYRLYSAMSSPNNLDRSALSRDAAVVQAYNNDPLVHDQVSSQLGIDARVTGRWALEHAADFPLPLLLMHGTADRLTSMEASRQFAAAAGEACTLKLWEGFYHELHQEPEQSQVLDYLVNWLDSHRGQQ